MVREEWWECQRWQQGKWAQWQRAPHLIAKMIQCNDISQALAQTALTRAVMPAPVLLLVPILMAAAHRWVGCSVTREHVITLGLMSRTPLLRRYPKLDLPLHALAVGFSFFLALPMAISLFPQKGQVRHSSYGYDCGYGGVWVWLLQISKSKLEEHIQQECHDDVLYYNKGLWSTYWLTWTSIIIWLLCMINCVCFFSTLCCSWRFYAILSNMISNYWMVTQLLDCPSMFDDERCYTACKCNLRGCRIKNWM